MADGEKFHPLDSGDISCVTVVDADQVQSLSQQGWRVLKVISSQSVETLNKNFPYQTSPGSYPSTAPYTEEVVVQRSKFVMGKTPAILRAEMEKQINELNEQIQKGKESHSKIMLTVSELGDAATNKDREIRTLTSQLALTTEKYTNLVAGYTKVREDFDKLKKATLETLVKLPGGNEVSLDEAGKMVRTGEIIGEKNDILS